MFRNIIKTIHPKRLIIQNARPHNMLTLQKPQTKATYTPYKGHFIVLKDEYKPIFANLRKFSNATQGKEDLNKLSIKHEVKLSESKEDVTYDKDEHKTSDQKKPLYEEKKDKFTTNDMHTLLSLYLTVSCGVALVSYSIYHNDTDQSVTNGFIWPILVPYAILYSLVMLIDKAHALIHDKSDDKSDVKNEK